MPGVILVLGLIAAGIYTDNVAFYWAAGVLGTMWFLIMFLILSVAATAKAAIQKKDRTSRF